jgi:hypothetical protein
LFWPTRRATSSASSRRADERGAYFRPDRTFTIGFTGIAPAGAMKTLDETGLPYSSFERVGFNDADYQAAASRVASQVLDALTEAGLVPDAGFMVGPDPAVAPGVIVVTITGDDAATRQAALAVVGAPTVAAPFTVTVTEGGGNIRAL